MKKVSIHAPAWGATLEKERWYRPWCSFNPRARVGRDASITCGACGVEEFQSTRPRGARLGISFR